MSLREYSGNAKPTTLNGGITSGSTSIVVADGTGFPTGSTAPFVVTVEAGQAAEERVLIQSRSGNTLTVATGGRGWDGTSASSHDNAASVSHTYSATDAREANAHINDATRDDHTQYGLVKKGLAALRGAAGRSMKFHYGTDSGLLGLDDGTSWHDFQDKASADAAYQAKGTALDPTAVATAAVGTTETLSSTTYGDLATVLSVAATIGSSGRALVIVTADIASPPSAGAYGFAAYAVSGATTVAPSDSKAFVVQSAGTSGQRVQGSAIFVQTGLTAGVNTFTQKYRVTAGTGSFDARSITVIPL